MADVDHSDFEQDRAAAAVLAKLRDKKWRQARDAAKQLWKKDSARYLPLLLEANAGLVHEMIGKGRTKDAETVVAYLETIAPPQWVLELKAELEKGSSAQGSGKGRTEKMSGEAEWRVMVACAGSLKVGGEISKADWAAIDRLVAGDFKPSTDNAVDAPLVAQLELVREACDATGEGNWGRAREALREVPGSSPFRHWRMFLRGVRCFFEEDLETAQRCFEKLPEGGGLVLAAASFGSGAPPGGAPGAPLEAEVSFLLAATGQPATWAKPLVSASVAWQRGSQLKAFEGLLKSLKRVFPTQEPGLASALTDAILPWGPSMNEEDYHLGDGLERFLASERSVTKFSRGGSLACFRPMFAWASGETPDQIEAGTEILVELWKEAEGENPVRDGANWHRAGEKMILASLQSQGWNDTRHEPRDLQISRRALERSVKLNPECGEAWLSLLEAVALQKDSKSHNRILGEASKKFPYHKGILKMAGEEALKRRTYAKSLKLLEAARDLDPLDQEVKSLMMAVLLDQTREYLKKGREVTGQWKRMEALLEVRAVSGDLMLSPWIWQIHRALLDPDLETAVGATDEAKRLAPSHTEFLLVFYALRNAYQLPLGKSWKKEWKKTLAGESVGWEAIRFLFPLFTHLIQMKGWTQTKEANLGEVINELFDQSMAAAITNDPGGLMEFVESDFKADTPEMNSGYLGRLLQGRIFDHLEDVIRAGSGKSAKGRIDLRIRYAHLRLTEKTEEYLNQPIEYIQGLLRDLENDAAGDGAEQVLARTKAIRRRLADKYQGFKNPDDPDDPDEEFSDGAADEIPDEKELSETMAEYLAALITGNEAAEERALAIFEKAGISEDDLLNRLKANGMLPRPAKTKKKAGKKPRKAQKEADSPLDDHPDFFDLLD